MEFSLTNVVVSVGPCELLGRVKLLSAAGSAAVLFNGIKESWRLAWKILSQFKLLWFLNVFGNTLLAILYLEIA